MRILNTVLFTTFLVGATAVSAQQTNIMYSFSKKGINIPKGQYFLIAVDPGEPGNIRFSVDDKLAPGDGNDRKGLDTVWNGRAADDLILDVSIGAKELAANRAAYPPDWKIETGIRWSENKRKKSTILGVPPLDLTLDAKMSLALSIEKSYIEPAEYKVRRKRVGPNQDPVFSFPSIEKTFPIQLEEIDPETDGVTYYRIPFTFVFGHTKSVVVLFADDLKKLSANLTVEKHDGFDWNEKKFPPHGKPVLDKK